MKIGIDISQIAHEGTGVANYTRNLVTTLLKLDKNNEYVLFYSSLRKPFYTTNYQLPITPQVKLKTFPFPPTMLDILWNKLHIVPVELLIGDVDVFISSDWVQPPTKKAKKITVIHDLSALKFPDEHHPKIVATHKRRLEWVKKECDMIICDTEATKKDCIELLSIKDQMLKVIFPGL